MKTSLTISDIFKVITNIEYTILASTTTTVCVLTLVNGHIVTGTSACVSPENFNQAEGEKYAFEKAVDAVWQLEGYLLRQRLHERDPLAERFSQRIAETFRLREEQRKRNYMAHKNLKGGF